MSALMTPPVVARTKPQTKPVRAILSIVGSLKITVVLLALGVFLVFVGTLAQIEGGIWTIVHDYFRSYLVMVPFQLFAKLGQIFLGIPETWNVAGAFPYPGGLTIGWLMLFNLLAAHAMRFKVRLSSIGIWMIHSGLIILMIGEWMTGRYQVEMRMVINHGEKVSFLEDTRKMELALIDSSDPKEDVEVTIPESMLRRGGRISDSQLPVDIEVVAYWPNADLVNGDAKSPDVFFSKAGEALKLVEQPPISGVESGKREDAPTARLKIYRKGASDVMTTKMVSLWFSPNYTRLNIPLPSFELDGKSYRLELRGRHEQLPFALQLEEFRFDRYPGTERARNYSSRVMLTDPRTEAKREVLIRMNEPLTYDGATYYQSGVMPGEKGTILHVTRNPGEWMPYISCGLMIVGMLIHFGTKLILFLIRMVSA